ncbi:MAG: DNA-3-methyladenine glycosylase 2 family protein [Bacteroidota bacterium]
MKQLIAQVGMLPSLELRQDLYANLIRSIVGQQLSTKAAATIHGRFLDLFDHRYPHPEQLLQFSIEQLRSAGLSRQKSTYVQNVAQHFKNHQLFGADWSDYSNEEILESLTQIKGVGTWTVQMILMFTLGREDVFPTLDVGIQNAMKRLYDIEATGKELKRKMEQIATAWQPYRTYACYCLWRFLDE